MEGMCGLWLGLRDEIGGEFEVNAPVAGVGDGCAPLESGPLLLCIGNDGPWDGLLDDVGEVLGGLAMAVEESLSSGIGVLVAGKLAEVAPVEGEVFLDGGGFGKFSGHKCEVSGCDAKRMY